MGGLSRADAWSSLTQAARDRLSAYLAPGVASNVREIEVSHRAADFRGWNVVWRYVQGAELYGGLLDDGSMHS